MTVTYIFVSPISKEKRQLLTKIHFVKPNEYNLIATQLVKNIVFPQGFG